MQIYFEPITIINFYSKLKLKQINKTKQGNSFLIESQKKIFRSFKCKYMRAYI